MRDQQVMRLEYSATMKYFGFGPEVMKEIRVCRICGCSCSSREKTCSGCGAGCYGTGVCVREGAQEGERV